MIFLGGPTAVGKTEVALHLAERLGGEIISVDSMQVYRGMDIGTAKPSLAERHRVRHHLIDVVSCTEPFDAAQFVQRATLAEKAIQANGHVPIFCGGTGLYLKVYLEGLGEAPPPDPALRAELEAIELKLLLEELRQNDPKTYETIDRHNARRIIRAVEVCRLTGKPYSEQRASWSHPEPSAIMHPAIAGSQPRACLFGLARSPLDLDHRIINRIDHMFQEGLVEETRQLLELGLAQNRAAMQAIGYRQTAEFLAGKNSLAETIAKVKRRTRLFAKRQLTWFRHQLRLTWMALAPDTRPDRIADRIAKEYLHS
jgi:tRNA dimethylallyltransferase